METQTQKGKQKETLESEHYKDIQGEVKIN